MNCSTSGISGAPYRTARYPFRMTSDLDLRGVWVPLITPFDASGAVDVDAIERLCREYLAAGAAGIVALGTTGEASALDEAEKRAVIDACARACAVGARTADRRHRHEQHAHDDRGDDRGRRTVDGVVGALVVVPYYVRPSEAGIVAHMQAVADASPVPIVLYNIPYRTGRGLGAAALLELAAHPNIAGVKQAVGALDADTLQVLAEAPRGFAVLGGEDPVLFPIMCMGGLGAIAASAHVCTERVVAMIECGLAGKLEDGRAHAEALLPGRASRVRRAQPRGVQGRAARAGPDRDPRPARSR